MYPKNFIDRKTKSCQENCVNFLQERQFVFESFVSLIMVFKQLKIKQKSTVKISAIILTSRSISLH